MKQSAQGEAERFPESALRLGQPLCSQHGYSKLEPFIGNESSCPFAAAQMGWEDKTNMLQSQSVVRAEECPSLSSGICSPGDAEPACQHTG